MEIEIWSDFLCPFCYIGKRRLEEALQHFPQRDQVHVTYRSFELDANAKRDYDQNIHSLLAAKYNMSLEQAKAMNNNLAKQAADTGLTFQFDTMIPTNSFDALRLAQYAATKGKATEWMERVFSACFTQSQHIGDHATLTTLAVEVGLDKEDVMNVLASDAYAKEVRADETEGSELGITSVPFFVINRKYAISGAQPVHVFAQMLEKVWSERQPFTVLSDEGGVCTDESCDIREK